MGTGKSKECMSESELSDDELGDNFFAKIESITENVLRMNEQDSVVNNRMDAIIRPPVPDPASLLSLEKLRSIEVEFDEYEMVSLIYLLYDNSEVAFRTLEKILNSKQQERFLSLWVQTAERSWQKKLLEALCIIQNFRVIKDLGFNKDELKNTYLPCRAETSIFVNKLRKVLYIIAENLTMEQSHLFIEKMKRKLAENNIACNKDYEYLELYFLYWECCRVDVKDIQHVLKTMDLEFFEDYLNFVSPLGPSMESTISNSISSLSEENLKSEQTERRTTTTKDNIYLQTGSFENISYITTSQPGTSGISLENQRSDIYPIDPKHPGIALIINQEEFYTEPDPKYKHLLHQYKEEFKLENREGTHKDRDRLERIFKRMNFGVIVENNLAHYNILSRIESVAKSITVESSFIVCILSHGEEGVIYGANSCRVHVKKEIETLMCNTNKRLIKKPKVLILQSCQGRQCQKMDVVVKEDDSENNATDGPTRGHSKADLLTFWATIPGYAAIRNRVNGSWFIQALCKEIEEADSKLHLVDICTKIMSNVTMKKWKMEEPGNISIMTPQTVSTLTKFYFLPPLRND